MKVQELFEGGKKFVINDDDHYVVNKETGEIVQQFGHDYRAELTANNYAKKLGDDFTVMKGLRYKSKFLREAYDDKRDYIKVDMMGKKHQGCGGTFKETSQHDDMNGVLHCSKCGEEVKRWSSKSKKVTEDGDILEPQKKRTNKVSHPFQGGKKATSYTSKHRPLVWENMMGTVYARDPIKGGEPEYFDFDWDAARKYAMVDKCTDLRICRSKDNVQNYPRKGKLALWGIPPAK